MFTVFVDDQISTWLLKNSYLVFGILGILEFHSFFNSGNKNIQLVEKISTGVWNANRNASNNYLSEHQVRHPLRLLLFVVLDEKRKKNVSLSSGFYRIGNDIVAVSSELSSVGERLRGIGNVWNHLWFNCVSIFAPCVVASIYCHYCALKSVSCSIVFWITCNRFSNFPLLLCWLKGKF